LTPDERPLPAGRVGRVHGLDGSFYVEGPSHELKVGDEVQVAGRQATVERHAGTPERPLLRISGVSDRDAARALSGELLEVLGPREELGEGEWYDDDLVGCHVPGLGDVRAVIHAPSCDLLEVGAGKVLVPLIRDAVRSVDLEARVIDVDLEFLDVGDKKDAP
jgi:16S rRNA processing protein RimM